jgi:hypothetical protein
MDRIAHLDEDIEMQFIREFSVGGCLTGLSLIDRSETIRVAIYTNKLVHAKFRDSGMDYGQAFARCFGRPIEMRSAARSAAA